MMLLSLPGIKTEFDFYYKFEQWNNMLTKAVRLSPPPPEPQPALAEVHAQGILIFHAPFALFTSNSGFSR